MVFKGIRASLAKKPISVIFQGGGRSGTPVPPLDPHMTAVAAAHLSTNLSTIFVVVSLLLLEARDFNATSLSTYDFSTLYITLPHNLI